MSIASRIKESREGKGWSQDHLSEAIRVHRKTISVWETGAKEPRGVNLAKLAQALDVNLGWLKTGIGSPQQSEPFPLFRKVSEKYQFHPKSIAPGQMVSLPHFENENLLYQIPLYSFRHLEEKDQKNLFWITSSDLAKYGNIPQKYGQNNPDDVLIGIRGCDYKNSSQWYLWLVEVDNSIHLASLRYRQNSNTGFVILKDNSQVVDDLDSVIFIAAIIGCFGLTSLRSNSEYYVPFWGASSEWFFDGLHNDVGIEEIKDDKLSSRLHSALDKARKESGIKMTWEQEVVIFWKMYKFCIDNHIRVPIPPTVEELNRMLQEWT